MNPATEAVVLRKISQADRFMASSHLRERALFFLYQQAQIQIDSADIGIVLGTSPKKYPDKFKARIDHALGLLFQGIIKHIIFTGLSDNETLDDNQARWAANYAASKTELTEDKYILVGGNNTQENLEEALTAIKDRFPNTKVVLAISENHHLIRTIAQAKPMFKEHGIAIHSSPVQGVIMLNPDDPNTTRELIKAFTYKDILYRSRIPVEDLPWVKETIDKKIKDYEEQLFPKPSQT